MINYKFYYYAEESWFLHSINHYIFNLSRYDSINIISYLLIAYSWRKKIYMKEKQKRKIQSKIVKVMQ